MVICLVFDFSFLQNFMGSLFSSDMDAGGWTLVMAMGSSSDLFRYDSAYWSNDSWLDQETEPDTDINMKNPAYSHVQIQNSIKFEIVSRGNSRTVATSSTSAKALLTGGNHTFKFHVLSGTLYEFHTSCKIARANRLRRDQFWAKLFLELD